MRTIRELIKKQDKVYILLNSKAIQYRFMSDAEIEGITYGDGTRAIDRQVDDIMALQHNGSLCFLGWAGHMCYHNYKCRVLRVDYEKYISGEDDYIVLKQE